jgi:F-type H+-transporting ATPase subunit b
MFEAEFWVAVAFVIFVGILGYFRVHTRLVKSIDDRRDRIKMELEEARRLKAEAEALFATYQRRLQEAEHEAQAIIAGAKVEAERLAAEAETKIQEFEAAVAAAERILTRAVKGKVADDLIVKGITDLKGKLN